MTSHRLSRRRLLASAAPAAALAVTGIKPARAGADAKVTAEELWLTDPRIGIEMNHADLDQGAKIKTALDLALTGDGNLRLNPGFVENHGTSLGYSRHDKVLNIVGTGAGDDIHSGSWIVFPKDFGAGRGPFDLPGIDSYGVVWKDFGLRGPLTRNGIGDDMSDMSGPKVPGRSTMTNITSQYWKQGMILPGDHHELHSCNFNGNSYGISLSESEGMGLGDFWADGCYFIGCRKASIAIGTSHALANFTFLHGHAGFSPYGIHRFKEASSQYRQEFMLGGQFKLFGFENCDTAVIWDEVGDGTISKVVWSYPGEAYGKITWPGKPAPKGVWDLNAVGQNTIEDVASWTFAAPASGLPLIHANVQGLRIGGGEVIGHLLFANPALKVIEGKAMDIRIGDSLGGGAGVNATVVNAVEAISQFDAVELTENGEGRPARNTNPYLGQAAIAAAAGTNAYVVTNGAQATWVKAKLSEAATTGQQLIVDAANPGQLKPNGTVFGFDMVARPMVDLAAGATGAVKVTHSQAAGPADPPAGA